LLSLISAYLRIRRPKKVKFYSWAVLEDVVANISRAVDGGNITEFPKLVMQYISTALHISNIVLQRLPWKVTIFLFSIARELNSPTKIPLLTSGNSKMKDKEVGWEYSGRNWNYWAHLLAKEYGWSLEYIGNLSVDTALAHIQEVLTDEQLNREFLWGMSEVAYPYNSTTKQSKFNPLPRPYFMHENAPKIRRVRIPKSMMPQGIIHDTGGMEKFIQETAQAS